MNPFDIDYNIFPTTDSSLDIPKEAFSNPIKEIELPTFNLDYSKAFGDNPKVTMVANKKAPSYFDIAASRGNLDTGLKNVAYTMDADVAARYPNYRPDIDNEKVMQDTQSEWDVFKAQMNRFGSNFTNTYYSDYVSKGRALHALSEGESGWYSGFNGADQMAAFAKMKALEITNPIYNANPESTPWYSMRGELGSGISSLGFSAAGIAEGVTDFVGASVVQALNKSGIGNAVLVAGGLGTAAMFNDTVRDTIGKDNANLIIGMVGGTVESVLLNKGIDKIIDSLSGVKSTIKNLKKSDDFRGKIKNYLDYRIDDLLSIPKELKGISNVVNQAALGKRFLKGGVTLGKMYMGSGAESGMEAMEAQTDYMTEKLKELKDKGEELTSEKFEKIKSESIELGKEVYNINKILLAATSYSEFGDIIKGSVTRNAIKNLPIAFEKGLFKFNGSLGKSVLKHTVLDSLSEGFEEGAQYFASESTKDYFINKDKGKTRQQSYFDTLPKLASREGLSNILTGILSGGFINTVRSTGEGVMTAVDGKGFKTGFIGYDTNNVTKTIENLNNSATKYRELLNARNTLEDRLNTSNVSNPVKQQSISAINDHLFSVVSNTLADNSYPVFRQFLEEFHDTSAESSDNKLLLESYGTIENANSAKKELLGKIDSIFESYNNYKEHFNNPYTVSLIDSVLAGGLGSLAGKDRQKVAQLKSLEINQKKAIYDRLVEGAARASFLNKEYTSELEDITKQIESKLRKFKIGTTDYDMSGYIMGSSKGFDSLLMKVDSEIDVVQQTIDTLGSSLSGTPVDLSSNDADRLKDLKDFKNKLQNYQTTYNTQYEALKASGGDLAQAALFNPVLAFITDNVANVPTEDYMQMATILKSAQYLNESLFFVNRELGNLTSQSKQKEFVEFLHDMNTRKELTPVTNQFDNVEITESQKAILEVLQRQGYSPTINCD